MDKEQNAVVVTPKATTERHITLNELRVAHLNLMERDNAKNTDGGEALEADVMSFVGRLEASGAFLADPVDRKEAQGILDYWSSHLVSNGGVNLRTWRQPRIVAFDKLRTSNSSTADVENTKAELSKIDENARQLIRISALARQWRLNGELEGYLLGGDALENAKRFQGQDKDIDSLIVASDGFVKTKNRNWRIGASALIAILLATVVGLIYLVGERNTAIRELEKTKQELVIRNQDLADQLVSNAQLNGQMIQGSELGKLLADAKKSVGPETASEADDPASSQAGPPLSPDIATIENTVEADIPVLPNLKSFDTGNEDDRLNAALDFNRRLRGKDNTPADQIALAQSLVAMMDREQFALLSPEGRHYLLFILSLIPAQNWETPEWSAVRDDIKTNLTDLQSSKIQLEPKSLRYLDALRLSVGLEK